ncbi:hypothetical protein Acr_20g0011750 [Actinidia rufa]|uniref:TauD/TfdA-like domain-containing protein n=1 Tax=Actinidia rufa TaxID=165716 RepID=A0A7J0GEY4_9ERIC|nr:hypothetical protein Acr_20g0011750 [Actinidia rufa]
MEFVEGKIAEEKVLGGGLVFPKTFIPPPPGPNEGSEMRSLVELIRERREWLSEVLVQHSAILFRGFGVASPEEFGRVVEAFGWEEMPYFGAISRTKMAAKRVYTANEAPLHQPIFFHHEMSSVKEFPSKIFFFCAQPSPQGGETSILPSHILLEKMEDLVPEFVSKLQRIGYVFQKKMPKQNETNTVICKTWRWLFQTDDEVEAQKRAKEKLGCSFVRFNEDGSAEIVYGPLNPIKEFGEKRVWFHHLVDRNEGDTAHSFGDGTPIPRSALDAYRTIVSENCVDIKWQKGDVLLVDNFCAQHGRRAGDAPRVVLVSICK